MQIDPISNSQFQQLDSPSGISASKDEFLRLLVAQLENQDPLEPQSGSEFVAQLAQFANVEQSAESNRILSSIQQAQEAASNLAIFAVVGRTATFQANTVELSDPGRSVPNLIVDLEENVSSLEIVVSDVSGRTVKRFEYGPKQKGSFDVSWDGRQDDGSLLAQGKYEIKVQARNANGDPVQSMVKARGLVEAIQLANGQPLLKVGGVITSPNEVLSIGD